MTVEEYMDKWLYTNKVNELKPTSFDRVEQVYKFQVLPHIGKIQISQLKSDDIQKMIASLKEGGYSYSTIKKAYECCNNCFTTGVKQRTLAFNPCEGVTIPRKSQFAPKPIRFYTEEKRKLSFLRHEAFIVTGRESIVWAISFLLFLIREFALPNVLH